jgi:hypothetical protein
MYKETQKIIKKEKTKITPSHPSKDGGIQKINGGKNYG